MRPEHGPLTPLPFHEAHNFTRTLGTTSRRPVLKAIGFNATLADKESCLGSLVTISWSKRPVLKAIGL